MVEVDKLKSLELINDKGAAKFEKDALGKWSMWSRMKDQVENLLFGGLVDHLEKIRASRVYSGERPGAAGPLWP